jgi:TonB-linked SusC/RagA family outer membrane protein
MGRLRLRWTWVVGAWALVYGVVAQGVHAQTGTIAGRVLDAASGQPIPAAQVFIQDLDLGVLSQQNGSYLLSNVPVGPRSVTVQRIGYRQVAQTATVAAGQTVVLDFRITEEALALDEIIVTGTPGGTQRRAIGNTVSSVSVAEVTQAVAITNMQDLLGARTTGLRFNTLDGNVGAGSPITIRGAGSFASSRNRPLVFVDGVRVDNNPESGPQIADGRQSSVLNDFNPDDIESIEIIKGPAAASLYGTEASAGVIQIITKRGQEGAPEFNISIRQGVNYVSDPAGRLGTYWYCPQVPSPGQKVATADANAACDSRDELRPYNMYDEGNDYIRAGYYDWPTENMFQNGTSQGYNLDVRGGSQSVRYFLSANYDYEEGFVWFNHDETFRLRGNVGVVFSDQISLDVSTQYVDGYTRFEGTTPGDGGIWQDLLWSNGYYLDRNNPWGTAGNCSSNAACRPDPRLGGFQEHLPIDVAENEGTRDYNRFTGSATLNFTSGEFNLGGMTGALTQRAVVGIDRGVEINRILHLIEDGIIPQSVLDYCASPARVAQGLPANCVSAWGSVYSETAQGEMQYERPIQTNLSFDYALTANLRPTEALALNTSFGAQYYIDQRDAFSARGTGFASPQSSTINQLAQAQTAVEYSLVENRSLGFYVQEEIGWNDRIFLTGALRFDDNSTFGVDAPAAKYPKISGTWVLSEESFWNVDLVNSLRLRGAWGKAGRQPGSTANQDIFVAMPGPSGASAIRPSSPGNPAIEPEVSTELELGFDVAFLDDRISGEFTHYWRRTEDALLGLGLLPSIGFPGNVDRNVGRIDNWGWEAQLSTRVYEGDLLSFDLDLTADFVDNEIKDLCQTDDAGAQFCYPGTTAIRIGYPTPNNITPNWVTSATFDPTASTSLSGTNAFGQRIVPMCDPGVSLAPATLPAGYNASMYGVMPGGVPVNCYTARGRNVFAGRGFATNTFTIAPRIGLLNGELQVFALAEGQYGRIRTDDGHAWGHHYNNSADARVQDDPVWAASRILNGTGTQWTTNLYDADFWKLREIGARYNIPTSLIGRTGAERASLSVSARNLMTIWQAQKRIYGHPVTDPEFGNPANASGAGNFRAQPPTVNLNVTLRVTF